MGLWCTPDPWYGVNLNTPDGVLAGAEAEAYLARFKSFKKSLFVGVGLVTYLMV